MSPEQIEWYSTGRRSKTGLLIKATFATHTKLITQNGFNARDDSTHNTHASRRVTTHTAPIMQHGFNARDDPTRTPAER